MIEERYDFLISREPESESFGLWRLDAEATDLLTAVSVDPQATIGRGFSTAQVGGYLLQWSPLENTQFYPSFNYRLSRVDPSSTNPLGHRPERQGIWPMTKFWHGRVDFGNPHGDDKNLGDKIALRLIPFGSYVLNWIPSPGRGTYQLWNFDPESFDPLPTPVSPQGAWGTIQAGHELHAIRTYLLDRLPETGAYRLWSFDPQGKEPVTEPVVQQGRWQDLGPDRRLVVIGDRVLDWRPADRGYRLWDFDPARVDPLRGPIRTGTLPAAFETETVVTGFQPQIPMRSERAARPGTIDFMRSKIKHVVYYMIENRSFDHVCGWLYDKGETPHILGRDQGPFKGASTQLVNSDSDGEPVHLQLYNDGKPSEEGLLELLQEDPFHDNSDVLRQLFHGKEPGYAGRAEPNMGGFVWNNGTPRVMWTYSPEQLPVLNGLARRFAVSDEWFCSMPGGTDVNRAFSVTGSSGGMLNNFQNGAEYRYWPNSPHRPSIWKALWANGIQDWRIYNSIQWMDFVFTYHLFLSGQIPTVDRNLSDHVQPIEQFLKDAAEGTLPAFSFLEPVWIAKSGTTSYHPGADLVPGEVQLKKLFDALQNSPSWENTLFVITFDEHGGVFDHVPPPYAARPWPKDEADGFMFDLMGVRVPTVLVSPWIQENTVFRSDTDVAYDATSFLATLLRWAGVPRAQWGLGDRTHHAPTFEGALTRSEPRTDEIQLSVPYDRDHPRGGSCRAEYPVHDLHRLMLPRLLWHLARGVMSDAEIDALIQEIDARSRTLGDLDREIQAVVRRVRPPAS